jgi:hypothetical protein
LKVEKLFCAARQNSLHLRIMTRHFWNIYTNKKTTEALHKIDEIVQCYGYIVDYKIFADDYRILQIEVESQKVEPFFQSLSENFSVEKYNSIHLNKAEDDEVFVNVKFF